MRLLFVILLCTLLAASGFTYLMRPDVIAPVPIITWMTDRNPVRRQQVRSFHVWQIEHGHTRAFTLDSRAKVDEMALHLSPALRRAVELTQPAAAAQLWPQDDEVEPALPVQLVLPAVELHLAIGTASGSDSSEKIIQGVSGVGSDIVDVYSSPQLQMLHTIGITADVTDYATELGFGLDKTYHSIRSEITIDGRQFAFPCNVTTSLMWVNVDALRDLGQPTPPQRWTFEQFEQLGKAYVAAADAADPGRPHFYCWYIDPLVMHRSVGLSIFNETLTACDLDDPAYVRCLELRRKWMYDDHIVPTPDDQKAAAAAQGFGGAGAQLFAARQVALYPSGRWMLIHFRRFAGIGELAVVEPPNGGYPTSWAGTRAATIYSASEHKDLAALFLAYLADAEYNASVVAESDALPPNPRYTHSEAFLNPPDHPNEWGAHGMFAEKIEAIGVGFVNSEFVLTEEAQREVTWFRDEYENGRKTAEQAAAGTAASINARIARNIQSDPRLQELYAQRLELQQRIDARLAAGRPVPAAWIVNPFYRRYYADRGLLEPEEETPAP